MSFVGRTAQSALLAAALVLSASATCCIGRHDRAFAGEEQEAGEPEQVSKGDRLKRALRDSVLPLVMDQDTVYPSGYKEEAFKALTLGSEEHEVESTIGPPFFKKTFAGGESYWYYSRAGERSENYLVRILVFDPEGLLKRKVQEFFVD